MDNEKDIVKEHQMVINLKEVINVPEHEKRAESKEFSETKQKLKDDGHYQCWICNSNEDLQVHHFGCEWSLANDCDFDKLKAVCELFDIYGYAEKMKDVPMTNVDDIRNMMVLCQEHHTHPVNGIHETSFPIWIIQKISKNDVSPVPESNTSDNKNELND